MWFDTYRSILIPYDLTRSQMILFYPDLSKHTKMLHSVHVTASFQSYVHCIRRICRVANVRTRSLLCTISVSSLTGICSTAVPAQCWFSRIFSTVYWLISFDVCLFVTEEVLKSVYFEKTLLWISILSELWYFQYISKQKVPQFKKKWHSRICLLKMNKL